jgi:hypothetical protein
MLRADQHIVNLRQLHGAFEPSVEVIFRAQILQRYLAG